METRRHRNLITARGLVCALALATACASAPKSRGQRGGSVSPTGGTSGAQNGSGEVYGPADALAAAAGPVYGPEPEKLRPVTLVLGPGEARGYANAGALRALTESQVPIAAIYGMEMGSLIGALYATEANINYFEWELVHFKGDVFSPSPTLLTRFFEKPGDPGPLQDELRQAFGTRDIAAAKIPLLIAIQKQGESHATLVEKGRLSDVLRISLATPGVLRPGIWEGAPAAAATAASSEQLLCDEARARYGSPVVLVDPSGAGADPSSADLVVRPDLNGIGPSDFDRATDIAFRGKTAMAEHMADIRRWVGMASSTSGASSGNNTSEAIAEGEKP